MLLERAAGLGMSIVEGTRAGQIMVRQIDPGGDLARASSPTWSAQRSKNDGAASSSSTA